MFSFIKKFGRRKNVIKSTKKVNAVEISTFDKWDTIREYLGDDELLDVIPKMLGTDQTERLIDWICRDYEINLDEEEDDDEDYEASKKASKKISPKKSSKVFAKSSLKRVTPKQLKDMVEEGVAVDITNHPDVYKLSREKGLDCIGTGLGIYGVNCAMFKGNDGKIYVITKRNTNLLTLV